MCISYSFVLVIINVTKFKFLDVLMENALSFSIFFSRGSFLEKFNNKEANCHKHSTDLDAFSLCDFFTIRNKTINIRVKFWDQV